MKSLLSSLFSAASAHRWEIEVMYFGRPSEMLMMTSERLDIHESPSTLGQVLNRLRERGARWVYELDDRHLICTINGCPAEMLHTIAAGDELCIHSRKSYLEA